ncbi:methionine ABC transporter ATP-binding protein [Bacillus glycinifermentans]|uniref:Methionine ABC transporter ATP-binding protein n=1 Tax=Bacillus glycinifermentans TaxID=1664069 RepID=A0A0T6BLT8_9BACI|nr:methionine ABC transporter ATP-binding protein [Bacillus glycinifermentans]ATH94836.1 methionine ABC transporter ATP-binding protein [Bacillus glycinifermentans]KRT92144.1 phosphate ABC transporter ATP-binding protein [Bacillus glycinifermentans]MEC0486827.1 methionine ABC transporter ATP-binding protein [Bacillus glycinifermentans]MEC3606357.1 methionine ABC transporter ATP-binding protein [Bacillus glycinifermentans]UOY88316.1 methionine ABC transporter ATP-binding protein [Bacillus glyci
MITFEGVEKVYDRNGQKIRALNGIDLHVEKGDIYGVIGFSGAGKSTLIRCVNFLEKPTAGKVFVGGRDLTSLSKNEIRSVKRKIGMVFQHFNLLNSKTIFANVAAPLTLVKTPKAEIKKKVAELLRFVGLEDKADAYPDQLSGGQKQRVGIARALATNPEVLLCDEATSALDPQTTGDILKLLKRVNEQYNITILLITHEMNVAREICDKVAVIEKGKIIESGSVFDVFSAPKTETAKNFIRSEIDFELPESIKTLNIKHLYQFQFVGESSGRPFLSQVSKRFDVDVNILHGTITELQGIPFGSITVELAGQDEEITRALDFIRQANIQVKEVK